jgi:hypothetical protein
MDGIQAAKPDPADVGNLVERVADQWKRSSPASRFRASGSATAFTRRHARSTSTLTCSRLPTGMPARARS